MHDLCSSSEDFHIYSRWLQGACSSLSKLSRDRINVPSWKDDVGLLYSMLAAFSDHILLNVIWAPSNRNTDFWKGSILQHAAEISCSTAGTTMTTPNSSSSAASADPWHKLKITCHSDRSSWNFFAIEIKTQAFFPAYVWQQKTASVLGALKKTGRLIMLT